MISDQFIIFKVFFLATLNDNTQRNKTDLGYLINLFSVTEIYYKVE